jgi:hypothetical protein
MGPLFSKGNNLCRRRELIYKGISDVQAGAGLVMAIALAVEQTFIGLSFTVSLAEVPPFPRAVLVGGAPVTLLLGVSAS